MSLNHYIAKILMQSVSVVAVYTVYMLMLFSCWLPEDDTIVSKRVGLW